MVGDHAIFRNAPELGSALARQHDGMECVIRRFDICASSVLYVAEFEDGETEEIVTFLPTEKIGTLEAISCRIPELDSQNLERIFF